MAKPQGRCVFCDGTGLTKQHIWPKWLKKINQPQVAAHEQVSISASYLAPDQVTYTRKRRQGHSGTRTARKVCKKCNNGWIERLEERIRDVVTRALCGTLETLTTQTQRDLTAWATLVTMMAEFTHEPTLATPKDAYPALRLNQEPPAGWGVWVVRYNGTKRGSQVLRHYGVQLSPLPDVRVEAHKCDTQSTTFVIGELCLHTFCSTVFSGAEGDRYELVDIPQIWPPAGETIDWTTVRCLGDAGTVSLSTALLRLIPPAPLS